MPTVHDSSFRSSLETRVRSLRAEQTGRWGKMSIDQMLWHVNVGLSMALGEIALPAEKAPLPRPIMKFLVLTLPWPKGAPTAPAFLATGSYDFEHERTRCLDLMNRLADRPIDTVAQQHPMFGLMSGRDVSRLQAKHLDHHLRQFGA